MKELVAEIRKKKELSGVSTEVIKKSIINYVSKHNVALDKVNKKDKKLIIKEVRAELRLYTGRFQKGTDRREEMLGSGNIRGLLESHVSTKERVGIYPELKMLIKNLNVKSILDLACGLNPIALAEKDIKYHACDIKEDELEIIGKFFEKNGINGKVFVCDLREVDENLPEADLCLLLKTFEVVDKMYAERILKSLKCRYIIVSFPLQKISGRRMKVPKRDWMDKILERLKYKFKIVEMENEIFYVIEKSA